jgi:type III secretion protein L
MAFIVLSKDDLGRLDKSKKIIKASDVWAFHDARKAVEDGRSRRNQILDAAMAAFEAEQRRGYLEGRESARLEQTGNMVSIISQTVDYFAKVEEQMVELVLEAVRRIIDDYSDHEKIQMVVKTSLALVRGRRQISVKVHPLNLDTIHSQIAGLLEKYPGIERLEVIADSQLAKDACIIESDIGQVEASMSGQIDALRESLGRVFGSNPNAIDELSH